MAERVISLDSDVLFFRRPAELIDPPARTNVFNLDCGYWYSLSADDLAARFGVRPVERLNAGLSCIWRESVDFGFVERCLADPALRGGGWLTEQTVHALNSTRYGVAHLPDTYHVGPGGPTVEGLVCKHYPGPVRRLLYEEGMRHLVAVDFLAGLWGRASN
jgi:hypothetical protein